MQRRIIALVVLLLLWCQASGQDDKRKDAHGDVLPAGALARLGTIRLRPGAAIQFLAFSPDGTQLACWCGGYGTANALAVYDVATGKELRWTPALDCRARHLVWTRNGRGLALLQVDTNESDYLMWEFTDFQSSLPKREGPLQGNVSSDQVAALVSPDGQWVASAGPYSGEKEEPVLIRRWQSGKYVKDVPTTRSIFLGKRRCNKLLFAPDGKSLFGFCPHQEQKKTEVVLVDVASGEKRATFTLSWATDDWLLGNVVAVAADPARLWSSFLAFAPTEGPVRIAEAKAGKGDSELPFPKKKEGRKWTHANALAFAPKGPILAAAENEGPLRLWDLKNNKTIWGIPDEPVSTMAFSQDGRLIATGNSDGAIRIRESATGKESCMQQGLGRSTTGLVMLPDGRSAVSASWEPVLRRWDIINGKLLQAQRIQPSKIWSLALTPDNKGVLFNKQQRLEMWNLAETVGPVAWADKQPVNSLRFSADGKTLATLFKDRLCIWHWPSGTLRRVWSPSDPAEETRQVAIHSFAISHDAREVVTMVHEYSKNQGRRDSWLEVWDAETGKKVKQLHKGDRYKDHRVNLSRVFTPQEPSALVVSGAAISYGNLDISEQALGWFDRKTGRAIRFFQAPANRRYAEFRQVFDVAFSADGRFLASAENDHRIIVFEIATGLARRVLERHRNDVHRLAYTRDGRRLVSFSADLTGLVWDLSLSAGGQKQASPEQVRVAWDHLAGRDGAIVSKALATLAANPRAFLDMGAQRLAPARDPGRKAVERMIADLNSPRFAVRDKAYAELDQLGEDILGILHDCLKKGLSLEVSRRLERLVHEHDPANGSPKRLREMRALELLEYLATPDASQVVKNLANGAPHARLTLDAQAALRRIASKN